MLKIVLIPFAWLCVGWSAISMLIPLVPSTPFLILGLYILSKFDPKSAQLIEDRRKRLLNWWRHRRSAAASDR